MAEIQKTVPRWCFVKTLLKKGTTAQNKHRSDEWHPQQPSVEFVVE